MELKEFRRKKTLSKDNGLSARFFDPVSPTSPIRPICMDSEVKTPAILPIT
jgi:hypothetical protein